MRSLYNQDLIEGAAENSGLFGFDVRKTGAGQRQIAVRRCKCRTEQSVVAEVACGDQRQSASVRCDHEAIGTWLY